ncbi:MAG: ABC transporter permease [Chloroflexi bacterium]|nr:ABC transporter permease [Chloroflexota bacterium]
MAGPALVVFVLIVLYTAVGPLFLTQDPYAQDLRQRLSPPSLEHLLGTDELGRDYLIRLALGGRISMGVGVLSVVLAMVVGIWLGLVAGYFGRWVDVIAMRVIDSILAVPALIGMVALAATVGAGLWSSVIAIAFFSMPRVVRLVRGSVLSVKERDFVIAAIAMGASHPRILRRHILPNVLAPIIVEASLLSATAILVEASLSFLGLGVPPPAPSWGRMLRESYQYLYQAPWAMLLPGGLIFATVLCVNTLGDALRDALDPRLRSARLDTLR